ncbi:Aste57867_12217 [Aphanomyces stellatus]|uniref:Aste57867_12217 protein n=1 Tax=Aphanomyces stellatus TaxID=120398 RepID=A0A485KVL3_9STRA|nr:hypothetical protein As57867_012172 [Aphanomyces stellatus]VFT89071.1 Aste57867_12217 [Aphanomyces stellatus]
MELHVQVFEARDLIDTSSFFIKQSPYCTIKIAGQKAKTDVHVNGGTNPSFQQEFALHDIQLDDDFQIEVKGYHTNMPKTHLGIYGIKLRHLPPDFMGKTKWYTLKNVQKPRLPAGDLRMCLNLRAIVKPIRSPVSTPFRSPVTLPMSTDTAARDRVVHMPIDEIECNSTKKTFLIDGDGSGGGIRAPVAPTKPRVAFNVDRRRISLASTTSGPPSPRADEVDWTGYEDLKPLRRFYIYPNQVMIIRQVNTDYMKTQLGHYGGSHVMVKSLKVPSERDALVKEVIALSKVNCKKILAFVGFYIDPHAGGLHCITQHAMANPSNLREYLTRQSRSITLKKKIQYAIDVAEALAYMHSMKMLHRSIKAENVMLKENKKAVLSGFGTCRARSYDQTLTVGVGDIQWSAPEMLIDGEYGEKVDVYSFGVFLVELETGEIPFAQETKLWTRSDMSNRIATGKLRPEPSAACPPALYDIIRRCCQFDQHNRPAMKVVHELLCAIAADGEII